MTAIQAAMERIVSATTALRIRGEDSQRRENHDGSAADLRSRLDETAKNLRKIAAKLEAQL